MSRLSSAIIRARMLLAKRSAAEQAAANVPRLLITTSQLRTVNGKPLYPDNMLVIRLAPSVELPPITSTMTSSLDRGSPEKRKNVSRYRKLINCLRFAFHDGQRLFG